MSDKPQLWYFEKVDLYEILCPHKVKTLEERHKYNYFNKNDFIYFQNEPADTIYMIAEGRIRIGSYTDDGKEVVKAILSHGEIFGELALTGEDKRAEFAQAMDDDTKICPMSIDDMHLMMAENKELSLKIFRLIGQKVKKLERKLELLVFKDARTRVIEFLKDAAAEKGQKVGFETLIRTKLTHKDIASLTGTSRQTVTTILNDLKEQNLINFDRRRILIRDLASLN